MYQSKILKWITVYFFVCLFSISKGKAQNNLAKFKVIAFYIAKNDQAHISLFMRLINGFRKLLRNIISLMILPMTGVI